MADLEELGYLTHPYTSAGRIPTDKGYRFYVDTLMEREDLPRKEKMKIEREYFYRVHRVGQIMEGTSRALSGLSRYTGLVLAPNLEKSLFRHLELVPLENGRILSVLITGSGLVKNKIIETKDIPPQEKLEEILGLINDRLLGLPLERIKEFISSQLKMKTPARKIWRLVDQIFTWDGTEELYLDGRNNILEHPEFKDPHRTKSIFQALEEKRLLTEVLSRTTPSEGVRVLIGTETKCRQIKELSLVTAVYRINGRPAGILGVIGPRRMKYSRVVSLVDFMAKMVSDTLTGFSHATKLSSIKKVTENVG
jgi:heat-inducible transcriptional repressor